MRLITLNGVKLLVYRNGMILRYSDKSIGNRLKKGWSEVKGWIDIKGYKLFKMYNKSYRVHRIIAHTFLGFDLNDEIKQIDHIDRNKLNNSLNNLRIVSHQENMFNKNVKGYTKSKNKYRAYINLNHQRLNIGYFNTKEEAHQAYLKEKEKYHIIIPSTLN